MASKEENSKIMQEPKVCNGCSKKCPDFDEDCKDVKDHVHCFLGGIRICANGQKVFTPMAKGYCPFIHFDN